MSNLPVALPYQPSNSVMVEGREIARALRGNGTHLRRNLGNLLNKVHGKLHALMAYVAACGVPIRQSSSGGPRLRNSSGPPSEVALEGFRDLDKRMTRLQHSVRAGNASRMAQDTLALASTLHAFVVNAVETANRLEGMTQEMLGEYTKATKNAAKNDPGNAAAYENEQHLRRLFQWLKANAVALERTGVNPQVLGAAMAASDVGKAGPSVGALGAELMPEAFASKDPGKIGGACFSSFLLHEVHGTVLIDKLAQKYGIDQRTARAIVVANVGHNGPATSGSWWETQWNNMIKSLDSGQVNLSGAHGNVVSKYIGKSYPDVGNVEAAVHATLDRIDQGTGGCFKIFVDIVKNMTLEAAFTEAFINSPKATLLQIAELKRAFPQLASMEFMRKGEKAVRETPGHYKPLVRFKGPNNAEVRLLGVGNRFVPVKDADELIRGLRVYPPPNDWV